MGRLLKRVRYNLKLIMSTNVNDLEACAPCLMLVNPGQFVTGKLSCFSVAYAGLVMLVV